jgi:hypothetical protein
MNKAAVICQLHAMIDHQWFGSGIWPAAEESLPAIYSLVRKLGLDEDVSDSPGTTRSTALGKELKLDLLMAFAGAWDLWEIPYILEEHGYIDESEADGFCMTLSLEVDERKLRQCVFRAYLEFCNRLSLPH